MAAFVALVTISLMSVLVPIVLLVIGHREGGVQGWEHPLRQEPMSRERDKVA